MRRKGKKISPKAGFDGMWELLHIRKTQLKDLKKVMEIYGYARERMRLSGNPNQWKDKHPAEEIIVNDIKNGNSYVYEREGEICGVFSFIIGEDPTYKVIDGQWLNDDKYGTIHRLASNGIAVGTFVKCLLFCESKITNIRIDTHEDNKIMIRLIESSGFTRCGIIHVADGSPRIAYQKVNKSLFKI